MKPEFLTNRYGLIVDFLAEYFREMRKRNFADALESCFKLGNNLNQRDVIAVRKTVSGLMGKPIQNQMVILADVTNRVTIETCFLFYQLQEE